MFWFTLGGLVSHSHNWLGYHNRAVASLDLSLVNDSRPMKINNASRPFIAGYELRHSKQWRVFLRAVEVKVALSKGGRGHAIVVSGKRGGVSAKGQTFREFKTSHHTGKVGPRWYESRLSGAGYQLEQGDYVLMSVSGHGTHWMCGDGGNKHAHFRKAPRKQVCLSAGGTLVSGVCVLW